MKIEAQIKTAFPKAFDYPIITDDFIEHHQNIMEINGDIDYLKVVPVYMTWCCRFKDFKLVDYYTVNALAEYGRAKDSKNSYLNFKFLCNPVQITAVTSFLSWCDAEILTSNSDQIKRALTHWINFQNQ
jgi:hypothetical protein